MRKEVSLLSKTESSGNIELDIYAPRFDILLPTRCNLRQRRILLEVNCPVCECGDEDAIHCFVSCHVARQVWALLNVAQAKLICETEDGESWLRRCAVSLSKDEVTKIGVTYC